MSLQWRFWVCINMGDNFHVQMHVHNLINIFLNTRHYYYFNESRDGE